jgi:uncharacterized protein DUF3606
MQKPTPYTSVLIDPASDIQVHHWAKDMQVEPHELRAAVRLVGPRLSDVRQYFGKSAAIIVLSDRRNSKTGNPLKVWSAFPSVVGTKGDGPQPS